MFSHFLDASAAGAGVAPLSNVTGADESSGLDVLACDVPTDLATSTHPVPRLVPGEIGDWDTVHLTYDLYLPLAGWPIGSQVDAFSCQGNPGRVYDANVYRHPILVGRSAGGPGRVVVYWSPSCSAGAEDYGIYEGTLGSWYSRGPVTCADADLDFQEDIPVQAADSYYLVVPHNYADEGSYGIRSVPPLTRPAERPQAASPASPCYASRVITSCP